MPPLPDPVVKEVYHYYVLLATIAEFLACIFCHASVASIQHKQYLTTAVNLVSTSCFYPGEDLVACGQGLVAS